MCAKCIEEFQVYQKALRAADEISAILKRPCFQRDLRLRDQLGSSSDAVPALMSDGFGQSTDRFFAQFPSRSRGESKETRTHLTVSKGRDYVSFEEWTKLCDDYNEIEMMLTGLIRHLQRDDRRQRG